MAGARRTMTSVRRCLRHRRRLYRALLRAPPRRARLPRGPAGGAAHRQRRLRPQRRAARQRAPARSAHVGARAWRGAGATPLVACRGGEGVGARSHRPARDRLRPEARHRHRRPPAPPRSRARARGRPPQHPLRLRPDRDSGSRRPPRRSGVGGFPRWPARPRRGPPAPPRLCARPRPRGGRSGSRYPRGDARHRARARRALQGPGRAAHGHGGCGGARLQRLSRCAGPRLRPPRHADQQLHPGDGAARRRACPRLDPQ